MQKIRLKTAKTIAFAPKRNIKSPIMLGVGIHDFIPLFKPETALKITKKLINKRLKRKAPKIKICLVFSNYLQII